MFKKVFSLVNQRPDLAANYVSAYAMLLRSSLDRARQHYARRALWFIASLLLGNSSLMTAALAAMYWLQQPDVSLLKVFLVPCVLVVLTSLCVFMALNDSVARREMGQLKYQMQQDSKILTMLREANESF